GDHPQRVLDALLHCTSDVVWMASPDGRDLQDMNCAGQKCWSRSLDELRKGQPWYADIHEDDRPDFEAALRAAKGGASTFRVLRPDGTTRHLAGRFQPITDSSDRVAAILGVASDNTDALNAVDQLNELKAHYQSLVDNMPMSLIRKDLEGRRVFVNQRYCDLHNTTPEEVLGKTDVDLLPSAMAEKFSQGDQRVIQSGCVIHDTNEYLGVDGEQRFIERIKGPIRNTGGSIIGIQVLFWDVTDRKRVEELLLHERFLLHTLLDNVPDCIYFKDTASRFLRISTSQADRFQLESPEDLIGKTDSDIFTEEHAQQARADELQVMQTGCAIHGKLERETWADREDTWCRTTKLPLRDTEGQVVGTFGISRDVTNQKLTEDALERERDLLRTLTDHLPDLIFVKDTDGRFITANVALVRLLGASGLDQVVGKTDFDFLPPELADHYAEDDRRVIESGTPLIDREESTVDQSGRELWLLTTKVPLTDSSNQITGLVGIGRNITKRRQTELALQQAKNAADSANQAKTDFLANMSHEIRTPMNAIIGMTELLLDTTTSTTQRDYLSMVHESAESLLTVINDVLDFSKIEAGRLELEHAVFNLHESLGDMMKSLALRAHIKGLELAFSIDVDVPQIVLGDVSRIRQVVVNLIGNAIKFTPRGEVVLRVGRPSGSTNPDDFQFTVTDTGIGIAQDQIDRIFDEFHQADASTTRSYGGTGLGLAISSRLIALMHGRMWVESELGQGSQFHFTIPLDVALDAPATGFQQVAHVGGTPVLIVDDNATNRRILNDMLLNWGMLPTTVATAKDAFQSLKNACHGDTPFRLVLTDVNMPHDDGFALTSWLRDVPELKHIPVVMLTSSGRPGDLEQRKELHVAANLLKPVKQSELFDTIVTVLGVTQVEDESPDSGRPKASAPTRSLRVLLAEDNVVNQKLAVGVLEKLGHRVTLASNGRQAIDACRRQTFDVVLMDVQMPEMDGLEATRFLRKAERDAGSHLPIVAMTAHAMKG
ncbi:MAG: PAS domain-containing protein, partial [Planctomycetaceae bacterium]